MADRKQPVVIALDADVSLLRKAIMGILPELACRDARLPVVAAELVLDNLLPVQPMIDVRARHHDARLVPLAGRLDDAAGRPVERVRRSSRASSRS